MKNEYWKDLSCVFIEKSMSDTWMDFEVVECWEAMNTKTREESIEFPRRGGSGGCCDSVTEANDAERMMIGYVKWDGCSEIKMFPDNGGQNHFCGCGDIINFTQILKRVYDYTAANMPHFDRRCADYPEKPANQPDLH